MSLLPAWDPDNRSDFQNSLDTPTTPPERQVGSDKFKPLHVDFRVCSQP